MLSGGQTQPSIFGASGSPIYQLAGTPTSSSGASQGYGTSAAAKPFALPQQIGNGTTYGGTIPNMFSTQFLGATTAAITLPNVGLPWYLWRVDLEGGAGAGGISINYDGVSKAHFMVGNGLTASWNVNWAVPGTSLPSGIFAFEGDANAETAMFTFGTAPNPIAPPISAYRSILIKSTQAGANTTLLALTAATFDVAPAVPIWMTAFTSAFDAQVYYQPTGGPQGGCWATLDTGSQEIVFTGAPSGYPPSQNITLSVLNEAACHFTIYVGYVPTNTPL